MAVSGVNRSLSSALGLCFLESLPPLASLPDEIGHLLSERRRAVLGVLVGAVEPVIHVQGFGLVPELDLKNAVDLAVPRGGVLHHPLDAGDAPPDSKPNCY